MLKNRQLLVLFVGLIFIGVGILWFYQVKVKLATSLPKVSQTSLNLYQRLKNLPDHSLTQVKVGKKVYTLEVVNTPTSLTQGLGDRDFDEVKGDGMIFVLPKKQVTRFWMKGMRFPLDFYWLDENGQVVGEIKNVPPPKSGQPLRSLPVVTSPEPVWLVVEVARWF